MQPIGPVRIEHRDQLQIRPLGWHASSFDAIVDSLIAEGAGGEVVLVRVETGEIILSRTLPSPRPRAAIIETISPDEATSEG